MTESVEIAIADPHPPFWIKRVRMRSANDNKPLGVITTATRLPAAW